MSTGAAAKTDKNKPEVKGTKEPEVKGTKEPEVNGTKKPGGTDDGKGGRLADVLIAAAVSAVCTYAATRIYDTWASGGSPVPEERASSMPPQNQHTQTVAGDNGAGDAAAPAHFHKAYKMPPAAQRGGASRWDREPTVEVDMDDLQRPAFCVVCTVEPPEMMFTECGHCCCCETCVWEMATRRGINDGDVVVLECPQCRTEGTMQRVYLP